MITADGWLDWAIRMPRTDGQVRVNSGVNDVYGIFLHSAEGYADNLLWLALNGPLSWHCSNLMDGRLIQHYPFTARCWHATAANNHYVGMEHEGVYTVEPSLNEAQIENAVRVIADLAAWKGWTPEHDGTISQTLWEHREVTLMGGTPTACPSGRIPWDEILRRLAPAVPLGIGAHYTDGTDEEIWQPRPGKTLDGVGLRDSSGAITRLWP